MRISDWSSDVCSSDLQGVQQGAQRARAAHHGQREEATQQDAPAARQVQAIQQALEAADRAAEQDHRMRQDPIETGRASCRARVCPYVYTPVAAVSLNKKDTNNTRSITHTQIYAPVGTN